MPRLFLDEYLNREERPQDNDAKLRAYQLSRDPALREELILDNLRLVFYAYRHLRQSLPEGMETEDAISFGIAGLIESIDRYDVTKGQFATIAYPRIQGAIYDGIGRFSWLRRSDRRIFYAASHAREAAERELGRELSDGELAEELGLYGARLDRYLTVSANRVPTPLEEAAELADDLDWSGLSAPVDGTIDLKGHNLTVSQLAGDCEITDSCERDELLEYIQSSGTQWIDTEYTPGKNTRVIIRFQYTTSGAGTCFGFGASGSAAS